jgi:hypothetical protein
MPSLQEIERFKGILNSLGSEPEVLAERGEAIEDLPPPDAGPPDLSDLFAGAQPGPPALARPRDRRRAGASREPAGERSVRGQCRFRLRQPVDQQARKDAGRSG